MNGRTPQNRVWRTRLQGIGLVFIGGAVGTSARSLLTLCTPANAAIWMIFAINTVGAALLGALLEALATSPHLGRRQSLRLLVGTGGLGGFTTYSTFAVDSAHLIAAGRYSLAGCYVGASLIAGLAGAGAGIACMRWLQTVRSPR